MASSDIWLRVHTVQQHNIRYHYSELRQAGIPLWEPRPAGWRTATSRHPTASHPPVPSQDQSTEVLEQLSHSKQKDKTPKFLRSQPVFCICYKNTERVICNEALCKAAVAARHLLNFHAPFRYWASAESLPKHHGTRPTSRVLTQTVRCTNRGQPPAGQSSRTKYSLLLTARAEPHRSAPQGRCLRSPLRRGRAATGGGWPAIRRLGQLSLSPYGPARHRASGAALPVQPSAPAPAIRDHRPREAGRPCPPRAAPPGHGQPLSTRAAASHLSPREAVGTAPGCPSPCGPGGPPVTPAPSLARPPSCRGYSIATAAAWAAGRRRPELGSLPTRRGGAGRGRGRRAGSDALRRLPPAARPRPWRGIWLRVSGGSAARASCIRGGGAGGAEVGEERHPRLCAAGGFSPAVAEGPGSGAGCGRLPRVCIGRPVLREGPVAGRTRLGRLGSWAGVRGASSGRTPGAELVGSAAGRAVLGLGWAWSWLAAPTGRQARLMRCEHLSVVCWAGRDVWG